MKSIFLFAVAFIITFISNAQSCTYCNKTPKVAMYDLDVQVQKPTQSDSLGRWHQLFFLSKFAAGKLFELNKGCVRFIQPLVKDLAGNYFLQVGTTSPMLPKNSEPSKFGDYIISGEVTTSGVTGNLRLKLMTACEGVVVHAVSVSFDTAADGPGLKQIAENAAMQLSPLADRIMEFAKEQREINNDVAYANWGSSSVTLVPKKRSLAKDQETEVQVTLKDCDGTPLPDREIDFSKSSVSGFPILGTTGGTVTPSKVTTDKSGRAKVKFKMGSGRTAMIAAHHSFNRPYGCPDAFVGSVPINVLPIKVFVEYEIGNDITFEPELNLGGVKMEGGEERSLFSRTYRTFFYHYPAKIPEEMLLYIVPSEKIGTNNVYELEEGYFMYSKTKKETIAKAYIGEQQVLQEVHENASKEFNFGLVNPKHTNSFVFYKKTDLEPLTFYIDFRFLNEEDEHEIGSGGFPASITVREGDDGVSFRKIKIDDPDSPYKTQYVIHVDRKVVDVEATDKLLGTNFKSMFKSMNYENNGGERLTVRILMPF